MRPPGHRHERTNFLTLPRELRQKILNLSFDDTTAKDIEFNVYLCALREAVETRISIDCTQTESLPHTSQWAHTLVSIHPTVTEDLGYVLRNVIRDLEQQTSRSSCHKTARFRRLLSEGTDLRWRSLAGIIDGNGQTVRFCHLKRRWCIRQSRHLRAMVVEAIYPA